MGYKSVCLECNKAYNNYIDLDQHKKEVCPDCGASMHFLSHMFKPPKKTDYKKWRVVKYLVESGFKYSHNFDMIELGVYQQTGKYPETMKEAKEFVKAYHPSGIKKIGLMLISLLISSIGFSQGLGDYINENAINVNEDYSLGSNVYEKFQSLNLIMIGEMHGTQEPAMFVKKLADLILTEEEEVSIGLEIPANQMKTYFEIPSDSTLISSDFFSKIGTDGRNSKAWFDLISFCTSEPKVNLFFFDNHVSMNIQNRDSAMYLNVKNHAIEFPNSKIITLSGNIHNSLIPVNGRSTLGNYCFRDSLIFPSGSICSINHAYSEGTVFNDVGNGLELRKIVFEENVYSESTDLLNYLLFYETAEPSRNNCLFYTRRVNPSQRKE